MGMNRIRALCVSFVMQLMYKGCFKCTLSCRDFICVERQRGRNRHYVDAFSVVLAAVR